MQGQRIILKFGGTSLGTLERIQRAAQLVTDRRSQNPIVVVSAMTQITNQLIAAANHAAAGEHPECESLLKEIAQRHLTATTNESIKTEIEHLITELKTTYDTIFNAKALTPQALDLVSSFGERLSSWLMLEQLEKLGLCAERFDARHLVVTNENFGEAGIEWMETRERFKTLVSPRLAKGVIPIITGFIGATKNNETTTLGRGGSDYSAAIAGVCLNAKEIQIWTDVDGMMTCDPRLIPHAKPLKKISFREAAELAYFGAKVLHPKTIQPAIEANIPVKILNTMNPSAEGTTIIDDEYTHDSTLQAIAFKKGVSIVNIVSLRMLGPYGFLAKIFDAFARHKVSADVVATSEVSVSITVEDKLLKPELIEELKEFSKVKVQKNQTLLCVVGNGLKNDYRMEAALFATLAEEKIATELISKGASQINLTFIVKEQDADRAITSIHKTFFE